MFNLFDILQVCQPYSHCRVRRWVQIWLWSQGSLVWCTS